MRRGGGGEGARGGHIQARAGQCCVLGELEGGWVGIFGDVACGVAGRDGDEGWVEYLELVSVLSMGHIDVL